MGWPMLAPLLLELCYRGRSSDASPHYRGFDMQEGEIKVVPVGFFRNYLLPTGIAKVADASILE